MVSLDVTLEWDNEEPVIDKDDLCGEDDDIETDDDEPGSGDDVLGMHIDAPTEPDDECSCAMIASTTLHKDEAVRKLFKNNTCTSHSKRASTF